MVLFKSTEALGTYEAHISEVKQKLLNYKEQESLEKQQKIFGPMLVRPLPPSMNGGYELLYQYPAQQEDILGDFSTNFLAKLTEGDNWQTYQLGFIYNVSGAGKTKVKLVHHPYFDNCSYVSQ